MQNQRVTGGHAWNKLMGAGQPAWSYTFLRDHSVVAELFQKQAMVFEGEEAGYNKI